MPRHTLLQSRHYAIINTLLLLLTRHYAIIAGYIHAVHINGIAITIINTYHYAIIAIIN